MTNIYNNELDPIIDKSPEQLGRERLHFLHDAVTFLNQSIPPAKAEPLTQPVNQLDGPQVGGPIEAEIYQLGNLRAAQQAKLEEEAARAGADYNQTGTAA
jgi:hypothetical protein